MYVAIDGSSLIDRPNSPTSIHVIEWLNLLHAAGYQLALLHPPGRVPPLPEYVQAITVHRADGGLGRLRYEQRNLPYAARDLGADVILVGEGQAPIASPLPIVALSSIGRSSRTPGIMGALEGAAGRAGSGGASARLSPSDTIHDSQMTPHTPFVSSEFVARSAPYEGERILCFGFGPKDAEFILSAWTYVDGSLGDAYPLTFLGADRQFAGEVERNARKLDVEESIRVQFDVQLPNLPQIYHKAAAYLGTSFAAGGQALRWALSTGTPVVGLKTPQFESVVGKAAYLVPPGDSRTLGAALLTVLIQERVSDPLREEGLKVAAQYSNLQTVEEIATILGTIAHGGRGAKTNGQ